MSDSKSSYGEPVADPKPVDDVVGSVNEGLADAEAAGRGAVSEPAPAEEPAAVSEPVADEPAPVADEPVAAPTAAPEAAAPETTDDEITDASAYMAAYNAAAAADDEPHQSSVATHAYEPAATPAAGPVVTSSEPVAVEPVAAEPVGQVAPQPIFVQAPEAPRPRGNRAAAGAIGLLAAVTFAVIYLALWLGVGILKGDFATDGIVDAITTALTTWIFWTPVVFFFIGFWLLGAIINRGRWAHWVVWGIFVGLISWFGFIAGEYFQAPFWMLTPSEGVDLLAENAFAPLAVVAFIVGRELTIWFGSWAAARGKRVTELNTEAMREYERTLEAGPQLYRQ